MAGKLGKSSDDDKDALLGASSTFDDVFGSLSDQRERQNKSYGTESFFGSRPSSSRPAPAKSVAPSLPGLADAPASTEDNTGPGAAANAAPSPDTREKALQAQEPEPGGVFYSGTPKAPEVEDSPPDAGPASAGASGAPGAAAPGSNSAQGAGAGGANPTGADQSGSAGTEQGQGGYGDGGVVRKTGKAMVHAGEYVLTKEEVAILGVARLDAARATVASKADDQTKRATLGDLFASIKPRPIQPMFSGWSA